MTDQQANISIAMATYNGERFIREQLDSLAAQTLLPCELVVTDDGSTDRTLEIVEEFAATSPFPVRVYRNETNLGFGDNFLKAASLCEGGWIAFCDQDDVWLPQKLSRCTQEFDKPEVVMVVHSSLVVDESLQEIGGLTPDIAKDKICSSLSLSPWHVYAGFSVLIHKPLLTLLDCKQRPADHHAPDKQLAHDKWAYFLAQVFGSMALISDVLALYRQHGKNTCGVKKVRTPKEVLHESLNANGQHYQFIASLAKDRAELLENNIPILDLYGRDKAQSAVDYYQCLEYRLKLRANIYNYEWNWWNRFKSFTELAFKLAYLPVANGGIGIRPFFKDFLFGFLPLKTGSLK